ncbi:uncharacterized protein LOC119079761 [Bradysia coprophila]|uniref:uncharacterized protein LOC119079761 n=1 Tax=Bradysia coprophila TaxID=38358 RepID=UPI00187DB5C7|nr:uncharacterized protein LOC119079761 [Bradysia coprophila]
MKTKTIGRIAIVVSILTMAYYISNKLRSVPYNSQKINQTGQYQPFYGYTIVAMIDPSLTTLAQRIEQFLRTSSLSASYSPLPASTYHMTIYSIYQCGNRMIPPIKRWADATGVILSSSRWLPDDVLQDQNDKAMCIIGKYLVEPLRIRYARLTINERGIKLLLEVDERSMTLIRNARDQFAKIYENDDLSLEPIDEKLHMGLAYVYAPAGKQLDVNERKELMELIETFNGKTFVVPSVYVFDSMTNYIPYRKSHRVTEC